MKTLNLLLPLLGILIISCNHKGATERDNTASMLYDSSSPDGKHITIVREGDKLQLGEAMIDISDNPNIAQTDIDAINKGRSKEIQYIRSDEKVRLEEKVSTPKE